MVETTPNNVGAAAQASRDAEANKPTAKKPETKKIVRLLTVVAYMMSVSMAAIMLSAYYIFLWNPKEHRPEPERPHRLVAPHPCPDCLLSVRALSVDGDGDEVEAEADGWREMSGRSTSQSASGSVRGSIKFAGEEAKDRMYEPKHKKKVVRVLTVIAYVFSVSLAAIMLSLYYIFIWQGTKPSGPSQHSYNFGYHGHQGECRHQVSVSNNVPAYNESQMAETPRALPIEDLLTSPLPLSQSQSQPPSDIMFDDDYDPKNRDSTMDNNTQPLDAFSRY